MKTQTTVLSLCVTAVLIGGALVFSSGSNNARTNTQATDNVSIVDGRQIITISAKGGYSPRMTFAKADIPTVIKMDTQGTFDCSSGLTIPSLGINKNLPPSGETEIEVLPQKTGTTVQGLCAMGMYNFSVQFN